MLASLYLRLREMVKLGQLFLQDGYAADDNDDNVEEEIEDPHKGIRDEVKAISARASGWAYLLDQNKLSHLRRGSESFIEPDVPDEEEDAGEVVPDQ